MDRSFRIEENAFYKCEILKIIKTTIFYTR